MTKEEIHMALEHKKVLEDIREVLITKSGQSFFKYLFKHFAVGEMPEFGLEGQMLFEMLGMHRAGNSVFKLASEANAEVAGALLAMKEKDRYAELLQADIDEREH